MAEPKGQGVALIEASLGKDPMAPTTDPNEADEGGEGELELHLRAYNKALRAGQMTQAAEAFKAAVQSCQGSYME